MDLLGYFAMLLVGGALGLLGGGGAILTVPILVYLFRTPPVLATSYSLFVVGVSSLFGVWRYHTEKLVNYRAALVFALPSFIGTYLARRVVLPWLPAIILSRDDISIDKDQLIMVVFALVMIGASASMIRSDRHPKDLAVEPAESRFQLASLGLVVGFIAGFVGAGGGFLIVPSLVVIARMPMPMAVGTSLLIIAANSLFGFSSDLLAALSIDWTFLIGISAIAMVGIVAGSFAAQWVPASKLKPLFGWFVLLMGTYILLRQWPG